MAEVRPFRALRYSAEAGDLDTLVAPPYDAMTPSERNAFAARNPYNIVHLTLPEGRLDDRSKFVKYTRSAALLSEWAREGMLVPDAVPSMYRYTQTFSLQGADHPFERTSLLALIKVEPFESGTVLPHEQTFPKHKEDRLRLLEATHTHLESIFGLYEDAGGKLHNLLRQAPVSSVSTCRSGAVGHRLEPITDPIVLSEISLELAEKRIWIADGHHRYETTLGYRQSLENRPGPIAEDYMVIALTSMADPDLVVLPTHRIVPSLAKADVGHLAKQLGAFFKLEIHHSSRLHDLLEAAGRETAHNFAVAVEGGKGLLLTPKDSILLREEVAGPGSDRLKELDATILHRVILENLVEVPASAAIEYTHDARDAIKTADEGGGAAFLMLPPSVEDMKVIALNGERMPQKSTYYYPKIFSGFVIWRLGDFDS